MIIYSLHPCLFWLIITLEIINSKCLDQCLFMCFVNNHYEDYNTVVWCECIDLQHCSMTLRVRVKKIYQQLMRKWQNQRQQRLLHSELLGMICMVSYKMQTCMLYLNTLHQCATIETFFTGMIYKQGGVWCKFHCWSKYLVSDTKLSTIAETAFISIGIYFAYA